MRRTASQGRGRFKLGTLSSHEHSARLIGERYTSYACEWESVPAGAAANAASAYGRRGTLCLQSEEAPRSHPLIGTPLAGRQGGSWTSDQGIALNRPGYGRVVGRSRHLHRSAIPRNGIGRNLQDPPAARSHSRVSSALAAWVRAHKSIGRCDYGGAKSWDAPNDRRPSAPSSQAAPSNSSCRWTLVWAVR